MARYDCQIIRRQGSVSLCTALYRFHLRTYGGLRASSWQNLQTHRRLDLGSGAELQVGLDAAVRRLWIEGWRGTPSQVENSPPHHETGFRQGYWRPEYDDSRWRAAVAPSFFCYKQPHTWYWARTHLFLPDDCRGQDLTLFLGGLGLYDYRYTRVFINGHAAGARRVGNGWHEPGRFDIGPNSATHKHLRFGQDNVIALQLVRPVWRTRKLDRFDKQKAFWLPWPWVHPGQYEQYVAVGTPDVEADLRVIDAKAVRRRGRPEVAVTLRSRRTMLEAQVVYRAEAQGRILHKSVTLRNSGDHPLRVMDVRLGQYRTNAKVSEGYMGFPVYIDGQFFASLAHPAGWALGQDGKVSLRQYAGVRLGAGEELQCMDAVLGVSPAGQAQQAFVSYLQDRMRRTVRRHDKPLAIFETFGGWKLERDDLALSENLPASFCLDMVRRLEQFRRQTGQQFDLFSMEFWADPHGDLRRFNPANFPQGFDPLRRALMRAGIAPGMWITSSTGGWNIGRNPVTTGARAENPSYPTIPGEYSSLCLAAEPFHSMLTDGLVHQVTSNGARAVKIDGGHCICYNTSHDHLPGLYSTQAIYDGAIALLKELDRACPDVFIMLYWGHSSPWWLLHADTLCESGLHVEAASPSSWPTPYARDGVTVTLDQAQEYCGDVPAIGKDSLGIWLSAWGWNSCIGKERWAEGMVMDLCRGSLLLQPWTDRTWLTLPERRQFAHFLALLRQRPECFRNSRLILGSPWKQGPYGYCCTDGRRAFIALNNPTWRDARIPLRLDGAWGLGQAWKYKLYRHYPRPARLAGELRGRAKLLLRPFSVVLLEALPEGAKPTGYQRFPTVTMPTGFQESSRDVALRSILLAASKGPPIPTQGLEVLGGVRNARKVHHISGKAPSCRHGGTLAVSVEMACHGRAFPVPGVGSYFAAQGRLDGRPVRLQAVLARQSYPAPWQAWRTTLKPSARPRPFELRIASVMPADVRFSFEAHFVPQGC